MHIKPISKVKVPNRISNFQFRITFMNYNPKDPYFQRAKQEGYRARSVYKLEAIQERFKVLKTGDRVLDLGAAPGSFLQYISRAIGEDGFVVGVDLQEITPLKEENIYTLVADVTDEVVLEKKLEEIGADFFDVITSDMAPATTGIKFVDGGRSMELNQEVLNIAEKYLRIGGNVVLKLLPGVNEGVLMKRMKLFFKTVRHFRPTAVRQTSGEFYLVGMGRFLSPKT
ncbi:hypothetical protein COY07_01400 [Candidatus Peregrinibacteria bacterium CG_4_10_14_0_2_um_filter_43_11]|nr:MAG: hypothetical protein COY07_01400 [Candidatus Peregrinibacteria bacterium CG_4_10_14_0_2_um_filter_43_11]